MKSFYPIIKAMIFIYALLIPFMIYQFIMLIKVYYFNDKTKDIPKVKIVAIVNDDEPFAVVSHNGRYSEVDIRKDKNGQFYIYVYGHPQYLDAKQSAKL